MVRRVIDKNSGNQYAAKFLRFPDHLVKSELETELEMLTLLDHTGIIQIIDGYEDKKRLIIVMEMYPSNQSQHDNKQLASTSDETTDQLDLHGWTLHGVENNSFQKQQKNHLHDPHHSSAHCDYRTLQGVGVFDRTGVCSSHPCEQRNKVSGTRNNWCARLQNAGLWWSSRNQSHLGRL